MLVQAKRLKFADGRWLVDISHRHGGQLSDLLPGPSGQPDTGAAATPDQAAEMGETA